ncbi:UNKNOWN [Stylonychia lemnae]|uniref:Uncharacterized protein n=1 Tax=Stylonychia lemnae TaxID=5949 RepID=A0A078AN48_STYLE|nr:UNKNOWN [Stylonychia lemnae]|eukprot:CDW83351.1 UNKNOWN [Stylonychia lemnae]
MNHIGLWRFKISCSTSYDGIDLRQMTNQFYNNYTKSVQIGKSLRFLSLTNDQLIIKPEKQDIGLYKIKLRVKDSQQLGSIYQFAIIVKVLDIDQIFKGTENQKLDKTTLNQNGYIKEDSFFTLLKNLNTSKSIKVQLIRITNNGLITLLFNDNLLMPRNQTIIEVQKALKFRVRNGRDGLVNEKVQNVTRFQIVSILSKMIQIQLEFSNPQAISQSSTSDTLEITFLRNYFFVNQKLNAMVQKDQMLSRKLTPQIYTAMIMLGNAARGASDTLIAALFVNFFLLIFMKFSMKLLWRMMAILQLIVNLPIFGVNLPSNIIQCTEALINISTLQIIDKEQIKSWFFSFISDSNENINSRFDGMDIFYIQITLIGDQIMISINLPKFRSFEYNAFARQWNWFRERYFSVCLSGQQCKDIWYLQ